MPSPSCQVKDGTGAYVSTTDGVDVTPGNTITINLLSSAGVSTWSISCITTDDLSDATTVTSSLTIDSVAKTATFTAPPAGRTYRFKSMINGGIGPDGVSLTSYSTTFCVYTLTAGGERVLALDETFEGDSTFGWTSGVNGLIRSLSDTTIVSTASGGTGQDFSASSGLVKLTSGVASVVAAPTGTVVGTSDSQTLTNKALGTGTTLSGASQATSNNTKGTATDVNPVNTSTSGAVTATLDSFTLASNTSVVASWLVMAVKSDNTQAAAYQVTAAYRNNAGTVAAVGSVSKTVIGEDDAAWDVTSDNSTTTIRLRVTGAAGDDITWTSILTRLTVVP